MPLLIHFFEAFGDLKREIICLKRGEKIVPGLLPLRGFSLVRRKRPRDESVNHCVRCLPTARRQCSQSCFRIGWKCEGHRVIPIKIISIKLGQVYCPLPLFQDYSL